MTEPKHKFKVGDTVRFICPFDIAEDDIGIITELYETTIQANWQKTGMLQYCGIEHITHLTKLEKALK